MDKYDKEVEIFIKAAASNRIKGYIKCKIIMKELFYFHNEINKYIKVAAINIIKACIKRGFIIIV